MTELEEGRADRAGVNEAMFRELNERIEKAARANGETMQELEEFVCECASLDCTMRIPLKLAEYEAIRSHPNRFAIALNHDRPDMEVVVDKLPRYWVIEKTGRAAESA
jgi:hypothetical protein